MKKNVFLALHSLFCPITLSSNTEIALDRICCNRNFKRPSNSFEKIENLVNQRLDTVKTVNGMIEKFRIMFTVYSKGQIQVNSFSD